MQSSLVSIILLIALCAPALPAQLREPSAPRRPTHVAEDRLVESHRAISSRETRGALPLGMLGGTLGSFAGIAIVGLNADCGVDDLACLLHTIARGGALGAAGATAGVLLTARATKSPSSVGGAALGAVVGTGVGLGVHWLLNRESDRNLDDAVVIPIFAISQGVGAALGSRWLAR